MLTLLLRRIGMVLLVGGLLTGCAGSRSSTTPADEADAEPSVDLSSLPLDEYEEFDPSSYDEEPLPEQLDVQHDVPDQLMAGRADAGTARVVQGYRIQVYSTANKASADAFVEQAIAWWNRRWEGGELAEQYPGRPTEPPIHLIYKQPYYRVRIGDFATEAQARRFLSVVRKQYPDAFVAQDQVTVRR